MHGHYGDYHPRRGLRLLLSGQAISCKENQVSVQTTADEELENTRESVRSAIKSLSRILVDECWGHEEFNPEFTFKLKAAFTQLMEIKKTIA